MIPAAFDYQRPATLDDALRAIGGAHSGVKVIAGGQSLLPLLKLRLASAETLVDIGRLAELKGLGELPDGGYEIGALVTYAEVLAATKLGWTAEAIEQIGDVGAEPGHGRWLDRPLRSGLGPAGGRHGPGLFGRAAFVARRSVSSPWTASSRVRSRRR